MAVLPNASYQGKSVYNPLQSTAGSSFGGMPTAGSPVPSGQYVPNVQAGSSYGGQPTQYSPQPSYSKPSVQGVSTGPSTGGGITYQQALNKGLDWNNLPAGFSQINDGGMSNADILAAIDQSYGPSMNYLGQAEAQLRSDYPSYQAEIQKQAEANVAQATANKQKALTGVEKNVTAAKGRKEDALSQARRLYADLQRANVQRFGGASSAGQAVSELQGQEAQRQFGLVGRDFSTFMQDIEAQKSQIEMDAQANLMQLESQKQTAINNVNREFQNKLLEINSKRAELESNKAAQRIAALQDLKNKVFAINQQTLAFQQNLEQMKVQSQLQLDTQLKTLAAQQSPNYDQRNIQSDLTFGNQPAKTTPIQAPYVGSINYTRSKDNLYQGGF